jgi:carbamoyl-phosphate synthase large subunit
MNRFLNSIGCLTVRTYVTVEAAIEALNSGELSFPLVVKPRWGSGSIGLEFVENKRELELAYEFSLMRMKRAIISRQSSVDPHASVLIQPKIEGTEYGLDIVNDLNGRNTCVLARRKLRMRSGETDKAITVADRMLTAIGTVIGRKLGHVGNLDCDVIYNDTGCYVIDMNPRFGGGYPFSHMAGANVPAALICWSLGIEPDPSWLRVKPSVAGAKCDRLIRICTTHAV